jgi:hypothetical protein
MIMDGTERLYDYGIREGVLRGEELFSLCLVMLSTSFGIIVLGQGQLAFEIAEYIYYFCRSLQRNTSNFTPHQLYRFTSQHGPALLYMCSFRQVNLALNIRVVLGCLLWSKFFFLRQSCIRMARFECIAPALELFISLE